MVARPGRRSKSASSKRHLGGSSRGVLEGTLRAGAWSLSSRVKRKRRSFSLRSAGASARQSVPNVPKRARHGSRVKNPPSFRKGGKGYNKARARGAPRNKR